LVLVDESRHRVFACNAGAALIWSLWSEGGSPAQIARDLSHEFGLPPAVARRQVQSIIAQWTSERLLPESYRGVARRARPSQPVPDWSRKPEPEWSARWTCRIGDLVVRFAIEPSALVSVVRILFRHLEVAKSAPDLSFEIRHTGPHEAALILNGVERMRAPIPRGFKDAVHRAILEHLYPEYDWFAVLHAGAVRRGEVGITLPAESGSGKTTLIAYLISHGYDYYADDIVAIAPTKGVILPWPLPLSVKSRSWDILAPFYPDLSDAYTFSTKGDRARLLLPPPESWSRSPVRLRNFVFPEFDSAAETSMRPIAPFEVLERLVRGRAWLGHPLRADRVRMFLSWISEAHGFALTFCNVEQAAKVLETLRT
jgi:hypothetical protein